MISFHSAASPVVPVPDFLRSNCRPVRRLFSFPYSFLGSSFGLSKRFFSTISLLLMTFFPRSRFHVGLFLGLAYWSAVLPLSLCTRSLFAQHVLRFRRFSFSSNNCVIPFPPLLHFSGILFTLMVARAIDTLPFSLSVRIKYPYLFKAFFPFPLFLFLIEELPSAPEFSGDFPFGFSHAQDFSTPRLPTVPPFPSLFS